MVSTPSYTLVPNLLGFNNEKGHIFELKGQAERGEFAEKISVFSAFLTSAVRFVPLISSAVGCSAAGVVSASDILLVLWGFLVSKLRKTCLSLVTIQSGIWPPNENSSGCPGSLVAISAKVRLKNAKHNKRMPFYCLKVLKACAN